MSITELIKPQRVVLGLKAGDKDKAMRELAAFAASVLRLDPDHVANEFLKRESLGSTAFGHGVALPHARFTEIVTPVGFAGRLRKRIDFDAVDGQPVDLIFAVLLPTSDSTKHLNALACVARALRDRTRLERLRAAETAETFCASLES